MQGIISIAIFILYFFNNSYAQQEDSIKIVEKAKYDIKLLCSDSLAGRGYTADGHLKAAHWLAKEFAAVGLIPLQPQSYLQAFNFQANIIQNAELSIGNKKLAIGKDFIPHPATKSGKGKATLRPATFGIENTPLNQQFAAILPGLPPELVLSDSEKKTLSAESTKIAQAITNNASGIILAQDKLTAGFDSETLNVPAFHVLKKHISTTQKSKIRYHIQSGIEQIEGYNVIGYLKGTQYDDTAIVICAHYDHLGKIGDATFYGANDNASGTAFLLALARHFVKRPAKYRIYFIAFGAEEVGLHGSLAYVKNPHFPLNQTKYVLNFDLLGNGDEGVMAVAGKTYPHLYEPFVELNERLQLVSKIAARPNAGNSDHYPFTLKSVPALFFYTMGGAKHYHDIYDRPETIQLPAFYNFMQLVISYIRKAR